MPTDDDDKRIKDIIGETSLAELSRWFGLPSFAQVTEMTGKSAEEALPEDEGVAQVREQRQRAIAAIDPGLLAQIEARHETAWGLLRFEAVLDVKVDPEIAAFDHAMLASIRTVAAPRELERPEDIEDELKERTPQALLRDLHRPELYFDKLYEVDARTDRRFDAIAEVKAAMKADLSLPDLGPPTSRQLGEIIKETRAEHDLPWSTIPKRANLPSRRIADS
jgi:hypothetical protein